MKSENEYIKQRTIELYDQLPQADLEARKSRLDIRDQVMDLNHKFFGYIASKKFFNNSYITYEDKYQSACAAFMQEWWKFRYAPKYRTDISFTVFFGPRIGEIMERELNEVKYSIRRSLCMEAGEQLGKHWAQVRYEDLAQVHLPEQKMNSLKVVFGSMYPAELENHDIFLSSCATAHNIENKVDRMGDTYDTVEELLFIEMVQSESKLDDKYLLNLSELYSIDFNLLKRKLPVAERMLYKELQMCIALGDTFSGD